MLSVRHALIYCVQAPEPLIFALNTEAQQGPERGYILANPHGHKPNLTSAKFARAVYVHH